MKWVKNWQCGLPDGSTCGIDDISFFPEFEKIQEEVERGESLHITSPTDWEIVLTLATDILSTSAKDVWVMCYGCRAAYAEGGLPWLIAGIDVLKKYLNDHWEELHPQKSARRLAALQWLVNKLEILLPNGTFPLENDEIYDALSVSLEELQRVIDERFEGKAPSLRSITKAIPQKVEVAPSSVNTVPSSSYTPGVNAASSASQDLLAAIENSSLVPPAILPQLLRAATEQNRQLALHYLALDPLDWRVYMLHRAAIWGTVLQLPHSGGDRVTPLRCIPTEREQFYQGSLQTKQYAAVLPALEKSAGSQPYWFDGHYMVVQCLEALGCEAAKEAVCSTLKSFLEMFPTIPSYKYHDNRPFASSATLQWLDFIRQTTPTMAGSVPWQSTDESAGANTQAQTDEEKLHAALNMGIAEGFGMGIALLGVPLGVRGRHAIKQGLLHARYCVAMKKHKTAKQLLLAMYEELEGWGLLDWEPDLTAQIVGLLGVATQGKVGKEYENIVRKLHWLHLKTALHVYPE